MTRTGWKVVAGAGGCLMLGPLAGFVVTVAGLLFSFRVVESTSVDPALKAQQLADGISVSMWATAIGIGVAPIGVIVASIALWQLFRKPASAGQSSE